MPRPPSDTILMMCIEEERVSFGFSAPNDILTRGKVYRGRMETIQYLNNTYTRFFIREHPLYNNESKQEVGWHEGYLERIRS